MLISSGQHRSTTVDRAPQIFAPEHETFRETLRRFLERELVPNIEAWEHAHIVDRTFWRKAGNLGLLSPAIPEIYGGPGGGFLHQLDLARGVGGGAGGRWGGGG